MDAADWAWIQPTRSSARGRVALARSRSSWRARSARFSSRGVSVRGVAAIAAKLHFDRAGL